MVWDGKSSEPRDDLVIMNRVSMMHGTYIKTILDQDVVPFAPFAVLNFIFKADYVRPHCAGIVNKCLSTSWVDAGVNTPAHALCHIGNILFRDIAPAAGTSSCTLLGWFLVLGFIPKDTAGQFKRIIDPVSWYPFTALVQWGEARYYIYIVNRGSMTVHNKYFR